MACNAPGCRKLLPTQTTAQATAGQVLVVYASTRNWVPGRNGKRYPINQALVAAGRFPSNGWSAKVSVKGIVSEVHGATGLEVFQQARKLFEINGETVDAMDLWLNLNLQWVGRVPDKYQIVTPHELKKIAKPVL